MGIFRVETFRDVISQHNGSLSSLRAMRNLFIPHAEQLTDFLLTYADNNLTRSGNVELRRTNLMASFRNEQSHRGNQQVFRPWNGWWQGNWKSYDERNTRRSSRQFHIWDTTTVVGDQYIQLVTQSETSFVDHQNIDSAIAGNTARGAAVDLGINVWSNEYGITGWVSKRQNRQSVEAPHIGYSPYENTLIWITQYGSGSQYYMFLEWVYPASSTYGIHGRTFQILAGQISRGSLAGYSTYSHPR